MAETVKEGDFVQVDYTGKIVDGNVIFDTTIESVARQNNLYANGTRYRPVEICVGKKHIVAGIDKNLVGRETGKEYTFTVSPEDGFGQKNPKLIQLISTDKFRKQGINPIPGLQVNIDGVIGVVRTVSGGRTVVDFNHPLAGKNLEYHVTIKKILASAEEKVDAALKLLGIKAGKKLVGDTLTLTMPELPKQIQENIAKTLADLVKDIKKVSFELGTTIPSEKSEAK